MIGFSIPTTKNYTEEEEHAANTKLYTEMLEVIKAGIPEITKGSPKQVAWAKDIRAKKQEETTLAEMEEFVAELKAVKTFAELPERVKPMEYRFRFLHAMKALSTDDAKVIIDHRGYTI